MPALLVLRSCRTDARRSCWGGQLELHVGHLLCTGCHLGSQRIVAIVGVVGPVGGGVNEVGDDGECPPSFTQTQVQTGGVGDRPRTVECMEAAEMLSEPLLFVAERAA